MPFDFPNAPAMGDEVISPTGQKYQWDGEKWGWSPTGASAAAAVAGAVTDYEARVAALEKTMDQIRGL